MRLLEHHKRVVAGAAFTALSLLVACGGGPGAGSAEKTEKLLELRALNAEIEGRWDWARIYYGELRATRPTDAGLLRREGLAWLAGYQQSWSEGMRLLEASLQLEENTEARQQWVEKAIALGELDKAKLAVGKLGEGAQALLLAAEAHADRPGEAQTLATRALEAAKQENLDPQIRARIHLLLATLADQNGDAEKTLEHVRQAARDSPLDPSAPYLEGRLHRRARRMTEAEQALARSEQLRLFHHDGTLKPLPPAEALALLREIEKNSPPSLAIGRRKLELLFASGLREEAESLLNALRQDPSFTIRDRALAATWAADAGSIALARTLFEEVLALDAEDRGAISSLAVLDLERGALKEARVRLEQALVQDPGIGRYHAVLARVALAEDRADEAERHGREAIRLAPWNWDWRQACAELLLARGKQDEFRSLLMNLPEKGPAAEAFLQRHGIP